MKGNVCIQIARSMKGVGSSVGHCQQLLSHMQYHHHRRLYFNQVSEWKTVEDIKSTSAPDVPGSSSSGSEIQGMYQFIINFALLTC